LQDVQNGTSLTLALQSTSQDLRPAVQSIAFQALRRGFWAQEVLNQYVQKTPPGLTLYLLWAAIALLPEKNTEPMYATHTLVNEAVNATSLDSNLGFARGLINAVLRRALRNEKLYQEIPEEQHPSYPEWWTRKLKYAYPEQHLNMLAASKEKPPLTLRLNPRFMKDEAGVKKYLDGLSKAGIEYQLIDAVGGQKLSGAIELKNPIPVAQIPGFFDGSCSVQDAGAQVAAELLKLEPGQRVLDACAAPGGKAAHFLEKYDIHLDALEIDSSRAKRIEENFKRLKLTGGHIIIGDASNPKEWFGGQLYDAIVADVPCSASGIVRRHPDITYLRQEGDIKNLQVAQRKILTALWGLLKPGGKLLYVTCSVFPDEGELQAKWWLNAMPDAMRLKAPGQLLPSKQHDGFFYALFKK
jgi:16S rRNA (cytosine967-C5)-methyltransferase